jgi:hypothetical protein
MAESKKQSRPVKPTANPQGVRFTYGTPIDLASLGEKLTIGNRLAAGKFKLEAHYPAKQFNNKTEYINKRKEGSYCRFYDNKSPYFIARTVWDADRMPGIHMKAKNKFGETFTFVVTPKLDDPTKVTILGGYVIPTIDGPVLCTGAIGELEAVGDDGDFKVVAYDKPNIRCPKSATGKVPTSMEYVKRPSKPRKTAADYCKPKHSFKHPTDIRAAEMVGEMADWIDEATECYSCGWEGTIGELGIETDPEDYTMPIMVCPLCGEDEWLSDLFEAEAGEYDEPCFSCDGMGADTEGKCGYCGGSGMMSETLKADLAAFDSEYFDAECGCWKGLESEDEDEEYYGEMYDAEDYNHCDACKEYVDGEMDGWHDHSVHGELSVCYKCGDMDDDDEYDAEAKKELSFMDWAKQEEASHLKKYGAEVRTVKHNYITPCVFCGTTDASHDFLTVIDDDFIREDWKSKKDEASIPHSICADCADAYSAETFEAEGDQHECITCAEPMGAIPKWSCECCGFLVGTQGDHEGCGDNIDGTVVCNHCYQEGHEVTTMITLDGNEVIFNSTCKGWDNEKHFGDREYEILNEYAFGAETFEAPLVGAGATMDIAKDTDLGSFTSKELTESSAISGDFDHASLNYSGNQNIAARAEGTSSVGFLFKSLVGGVIVAGSLAAGMYSAKKIIEIGDDE